jgi:hypothetical protein
MKKHIIKFIALALLITALGVIPVGQVALAAKNSGMTTENTKVMQGTDAFVNNPNTQSRDLVFAYWTTERMAAAQPPPVIGRTAGSSQGSDKDLMANGPAMYVNGHTPGGAGSSPVTAAVPGSAVASATINLTYPFPYTRTQNPWPSLYDDFPFRTHGKLFFTNAGYGGGTFVCSGTSVTSGVGGNENLVLTAAHCLNSGGDGNNVGTWSDNLLFVPGRRNSVNLNGSWGWIDAVIQTNWYTDANIRQDYGFLITADNPSTLSDYVGAQGLAWNQSAVQQFWAYGYPAVSPFSGELMMMCTATTAVRAAEAGAGGFAQGEQPLGIGCDMTGGSSGGGWIVWHNLLNAGYANSVNSFKYTSPSQPNAMYGPYFDGNFQGLWDYARLLYAP